jgi:hypothetical protein
MAQQPLFKNLFVCMKVKNYLRVIPLGPNSLRCIKILSQGHLFPSFLPSLFLPCKDTFMDDYDGI